MTKIENVRGRSAKHQYVDKDGTWLPGTTTIVDLLGPVGGLGYWGFQVGKSGEVDDYWAYLKGLASAGSCAHARITSYVLGDEEPDLSMFTQTEIDVANACLDKYVGWASKHDVKILYAERPLVSEEYKFGGTFDLYGHVDGVASIIDLKSSSDVRESHKVQTAAYSQLAREAGLPVSQLIVLPLGRDADEPMRKVWSTTDIQPLWETFEHLLAIYRLQQTNKKRKGEAA